MSGRTRGNLGKKLSPEELESAAQKQAKINARVSKTNE